MNGSLNIAIAEQRRSDLLATAQHVHRAGWFARTTSRRRAARLGSPTTSGAGTERAPVVGRLQPAEDPASSGSAAA
jgi:hypothetical protein